MNAGKRLEDLAIKKYTNNKIMKEKSKIYENSESNHVLKKRVTWTEHKRLWKLSNQY